MPGWSVEDAGSDDLVAIRSLLEDVDLPATDVGRTGQIFFVARMAGAVIGCVGMEPYGEVALLRSLAVTPRYRGQGLSFALFERVTNEARSLCVRDLYLLTTTAEALFARWGFRRVVRDQVPAPVRESAEFTSLCPTTAACMVRTLR
jgi:amino-acid N-acetyltransferase